MIERQMTADDLMSSDTRAVKALKSLYVDFCEASDCHLANVQMFKNRRTARSDLLGLSQAYGWAAKSVADEIKKLGHEVPEVASLVDVSHIEKRETP